MLQIGQVLNSRYRIVKLLAQGGFGTVYRAWDINLNMSCALKENLENTLESQRQFTREANLLATLHHSNLPRVIDHFIIPGQGQYLVMDFIEGEDLEDMRQKQGGALPEAQVLPWIRQVCDALIFLHSQNPPVIHRDIKPANIRITQDGRTAVLVDFGIAKQSASGSTFTAAKAVTPGFSPPEQYMGTGTDQRSDVYALGATLYTLLTGVELQESIQRLMVKTGTRPPHMLRAGVRQHISTAVMRAIEPNQNARLGSVNEFKDLLFKVKTKPPVPASTPKPKWLIGVIGLFMIMVVVGIGLSASAQWDRVSPTSITATWAPTQAISGSTPSEGQGPAGTGLVTIAPPTTAPTSAPVASVWQQGRLAFPLRGSGTNSLQMMELTKGLDMTVMVADAVGGKLAAPQFSPDGQRILYHYYMGNLYRRDLKADASPNMLADCETGSWSPDAQRILCNHAGETTFSIIDVASGRQTGMLDVGHPARIPAWSPDGSEFAYVVAENSTTAIYRKSLVDGSQPQLLANASPENYAPSYSPDGQWIAFQSRNGSSLSEVWIMDRNGGNQRRITNTPDGSWSRAPAWSPDGQWLAFVSNQAGSSGEDYGEVFVISLTTGKQIQVTHTDGKVYDWRVAWGK